MNNDADRAFTAYQAHGRPEDLARVFDACAPQLLLLANHVAGDGTVAEDLVQLTFLRAIEGVDKFEAGRPVQPWLVGILVREAKNHRRQARREPDQDRVRTPGGEPVPLDAAESAEFQATLTAALDDLPRAYREVMTLRLIHGLTPTEIGHLRGVSPETIKTQIRRGCERLRKLLPPSFAQAMIVLAATGGGLAAAREIVLHAARSVAEGVAAAAATEAALELSRSSSPELPEAVPDSAWVAEPRAMEPVVADGGSTAASAANHLQRAGRLAVPAATATATGSSRPLAWALGLTAAAAVGVWAIDPFSGEGPKIDPVEIRVEVPDPAERPRVLRTADTPEEESPEKPPQVDPSLASFHGRVLRASRTGAGQLKVDLLRLHPDVLVVPAAGLPSWTAAADFLVGSTLTNDRGDFSFADVHPAGIFVVVIGAGTELAKWHLVPRSVRAKEHVELGEFQVGQRRVARGRIVDEQGFGLAGVTLRQAGVSFDPGEGLGMVGAVLQQVARDRFEPGCAVLVPGTKEPQLLEVPSWFTDWFDVMVGRSVVTDHTGRFEWIDDSRGVKTLLARAPGYRLLRVKFDLSGESTDVGKFMLIPAAEVAGRVWDERGDPLPFAEVRLAPWARHRGVVTGPILEANADGEFRSAWDQGNQMAVAVRRDAKHPWHLFGPIPPSDRITVTLPQRFDVRLRVQRLHGAVRSALDVAPILRLLPGPFEPERHQGLLTMHQLGCVPPIALDEKADEEAPGNVTLRGVPEGEWTLLVSAKGYASMAVACNVRGAMELPLLLRPLEKTDVTVHDPLGRSVIGAPVYACADELDRVHEFPVRIGSTGEDGTLGLRRNIERRNLITSVSSEFGVTAGRAAAGIAKAGMRFVERGVIYGKLTVGGSPAGGGWSVLARRGPARPGELPPGLPIPTVLAQVRPDGTFELPPMEPGNWILRARQMGIWVNHPTGLLDVLFTDQAEVPTMAIELHPRERRGVQFEALAAPESEEESEEDKPILPFAGNLTLQPRPGTPAWIGVKSGAQWTWFPIAQNGEFDTGMMLVPGNPVSVQLKDFPAPVGAPESWLWSGLVDPSTERFQSVVDLHLSSFTVLAAPRNRSRDRAGQLRFVIEGEAGTPSFRQVGVTDSQGWFRCHVPPGRYRFQAESLQSGWIDQRQIAIEFAGPHSLEMQPLLLASGRVDAAALNHELPEGSMVRFTRVGGATPIDKAVRIARNTKDFQVEGLMPGDYRVEVLAAVRTASGRIVPAASSGVKFDQGIVKIGSGNRLGILLRQR